MSKFKLKVEAPEPRETVEKKTEYEKIPEGFYEVYVDTVDAPELRGDFESSTIRLRLRDDVPAQEDYARRILFVNINTNPAIAWKLSNLATGAGVASGTEFTSLEEYLEAIMGASMKVKMAYREYNGKVYEDVKAFYPTSLAPYKAEEEEADTDLI